MVWRQEEPDVLNNKIPQTDNETLKKTNMILGSFNCSITSRNRKISMFLCEAFLLWGNASHSNQSHWRHKLKNGQDDPEFGDSITYGWLDLFNPSKQN